MIIAGLVTGAKRGILYIRHEYEAQEHIFQKEIDRLKEQGLVGENMCAAPACLRLEVFVSPGGYICGEETALIEAIEGNRAEPRNKPPFPCLKGSITSPPR
jgi:formate dehydrogenase beta subunit